MTNEEIVARGIRAQETLVNETIAQAVDDLIKAVTDTFLTTAPEDHMVRERAYYTYQGIRDLVGLLNQWAWAKEQIVMVQRAEEETE